MAKKERFSFLSSDKKTTIYGVRWRPDAGRIRAVLQIVHGMTEYIERYEEFAKYLTEQGIMVVGHDQLGHGDSVNSRDDWGYFEENRGGDCLVWDTHHVRVGTQRRCPGVPYFILGHSMGSFVLRKYLTKYGEGISGAVIMGTGMVPDGVLLPGMALIRAMAAVKGWKYRSLLVNRLVFSEKLSRFCMDGSQPENSWLTKDCQKVREYYEDERCSFRFTLNGFYTLFQLISYGNQRAFAEKISETLPILLVSGTDDMVGDYGNGVRKVYRQLKKVGIQDVTLRLFEDDRHEILNETDRERVFLTIVQWMFNIERFL